MSTYLNVYVKKIYIFLNLAMYHQVTRFKKKRGGSEIL